MKALNDFERYLELLCKGLGHSNRHRNLVDYCYGLMLPIEQKNIESLAAYADPANTSAKRQALHHFVSKSDWSDEAVRDRVLQWAAPALRAEHDAVWIIDDTCFANKGRHSAGAARQHCGQMGRQDNCQVAVSLSLANEKASLPVEYRLYLPREWAEDDQRRAKVGVPEDIAFATKPELALEMLHRAKKTRIPCGTVLADVGYGKDTAFRDGLTSLGLPYVVGVTSQLSVWPAGRAPLPPLPHARRGRPSKLLRRGPGHEPIAIKSLARELPATAWRTVTWREGGTATLTSRFAAVRVRPSHRDFRRSEVRQEEWLLMEWLDSMDAPTRFWLSTLPEDVSLERLVKTAKMHWRIERDQQELKQEYGLGHFEGHSWRGFHHHATLCVAAYAFFLAARLKRSEAPRQPVAEQPALQLVRESLPRCTHTAATARTGLDLTFVPAHHRLASCSAFAEMPLLRRPSEVRGML